jgi:cytoplasmic tRNA 2-thiolation protein 1
MDEIVKQIGLKNNCESCLFSVPYTLAQAHFVVCSEDKRWIEVPCSSKQTKLSLDIMQMILLKLSFSIVRSFGFQIMTSAVLRGDISRLARCTAITTGQEGSLPRCKPFKYTYEKEIVMYPYIWTLSFVLDTIGMHTSRSWIISQPNAFTPQMLTEDTQENFWRIWRA